MSNIQYDEWRQDIISPEGVLVKNVLFIRARRGNIEYHAPVFDEGLEDKLVEQLKEDTKEILRLKVERLAQMETIRYVIDKIIARLKLNTAEPDPSGLQDCVEMTSYLHILVRYAALDYERRYGWPSALNIIES